MIFLLPSKPPFRRDENYNVSLSEAQPVTHIAENEIIWNTSIMGLIFDVILR